VVPILSLDKVTPRVRKLCYEIAGKNKIVAACLYGSRVCGYARPSSDYDVILIIDPYSRKVKYHYKKMGRVDISVLAVEKAIFEDDIDNAILGEFVAGRLTTPYVPLVNRDYLWKQETRMKKRIILETLENLIHRYKDFCCEILIDPHFFAYSKMQKRAMVYQPVKYSYVKMLSSGLGKQNILSIMKGYEEALRELHAENVVIFEDKYVKISKAFAEEVNKKIYNVVVPLRETERVIRQYISHGFAGSVGPRIILKELASKVERELEEQSAELEDPKNYLYLHSAHGTVSLGDKYTFEDVITTGAPFGKVSELSFRNLGGTLNFVYLLSFRENNKERKVVAKRYEDWCGLKWMPLSLWTMGLQEFEVFGEKRLMNEYKMSGFLARHGVSTPEIYYINLEGRLLLQQYIEGRNFEEVIHRIFSKGHDVGEDLSLIRRLAQKIAEIHSLNVTIGDCKPENIILSPDDGIYFVDLEQAGKGNPVWDIAEFLYYTGHYTVEKKRIMPLVEAFTEGYIERGDAQCIRDAGSLSYVRVFSLFTPPNILMEISKACLRH